jgi:hypothetical protein
MKKMLCYLLLLSSCIHPHRNLKSKGQAVTKKVIEIDSLSYISLNEKLSKLDYDDTTNQNAISNSKLIDDFYAFLTKEVPDYTMYKLFFNEMTSSRDTVFILNKGQNFYRYIKKDSKTKLIFDSYMEDTRSLPNKIRNKILHLTEDRSKPLVISDSTFSSSLMIDFKNDTIHRMLFVYYLD